MADKQYPISSWTGECATHMGKMYVTVTYNTGRVQEVIGTIGGSNSCMRAEVEATSRLINVALDHLAYLPEIIEQLNGITCEPLWVDGNHIKSPSDAFAKILTEFCQLNLVV